MRGILFSIIFLFVFCSFAKAPENYSDWSFTGDFFVFHRGKLTRDDAAKAQYAGKLGNLDGKRLASLDTAPDFNKLFGYTQSVPGRTAVVVNKINVKKDGRIQIGVGADWQIAVFIDGKNVFDTREMGGNGTAPAKKSDHAVDVAVKKGEHTVAFWVSGGATTWTVGAGKIPYTQVRYPAPVLKYGPYLANVSSESAVISLVTEAPVPMGIAIRRPGERDYRQYWSSDGYQIALHKKLHRITVDGLSADTAYEYKLITLERPENKLVFMDGNYKLTTASKIFKPFKVFVTGDLQFLPEKQKSILEKYMATKQAESSQFFISLGDSSGAFWNFEKSMFDVVLDPVLAASCNEKNILMVRGNHEFRGSETHLFDDHFALSNGRSYGVYCYNDVAFIILDCGNGQKRSMANTRHYMAYDLPGLLLREQRKVLAQEVASEAYRKAKYRVVLSHSAIYGVDVSDAISKYARQIISGIIDEKDIHLWLSGHIHRYRRTVPEKSGFYAFSAPGKRENVLCGGKYNFVTMIIDGPGAAMPHSGHTVEFTANGINVESFFEDGRVFDSFKLDKNGRCIGSSPSEILQFYGAK